MVKNMTKSVTTSIRLTPQMLEQLNEATLVLHHGKNWIIVKAIEQYLTTVKPLNLAEEAKKQCLLANQLADETEEALWENNMDTDQWE